MTEQETGKANHRLTLATDDGQRDTPCSATTTLPDGMRAAGLPVRKACRNGVCGLCRCRLLAGQTTYHWKAPHGLWQKDIDAGYILPCIAYPLSDVTLG